MAPAALFLAAKVEEQPHKLEHVIKVAHACLHPQEPPPDTRSEVSFGVGEIHPDVRSWGMGNGKGLPPEQLLLKFCSKGAALEARGCALGWAVRAFRFFSELLRAFGQRMAWGSWGCSVPTPSAVGLVETLPNFSRLNPKPSSQPCGKGEALSGEALGQKLPPLL